MTKLLSDHVYYTVQTEAERTAAYKLGVNCGGGRFWFTRSDWNQFVDETAEDKQEEAEEE